MKKKVFLLSLIFTLFCISNIYAASDKGIFLVKQEFINKYNVASAGNKSGENGYIYNIYNAIINENRFYIDDDENFDENYYIKNYFSKVGGGNSAYTETQIERKVSKVNDYRAKNNQKNIEGIKIYIFYSNDKLTTGQWFYTYWDNQNNIILTQESLYSESDDAEENKPDDFWGDASEWFGNAQESGYETPTQVNDIIGIFSDMINVVGTTVIVIATIVLGIKYIIGSVESKTSAKEGLITLFIACVFFFGWTAIKGLLFPNNNFIFTSTSDTSYTNMVGRIFSTFTYIAQFVVVASIIYVGIKYIFAGADGRAELKGKSVYFIIGIILVFATTNVLSFVSNIITETIGDDSTSKGNSGYHYELNNGNTTNTPSQNDQSTSGNTTNTPSTYHESTNGHTHGGGGKEL